TRRAGFCTCGRRPCAYWVSHPEIRMSETTALEARIAKLGKASQRAAILSLLGFLGVLGALLYASWQLRDLEKQKAALEDQIQERKKELLTLEAWKTRLTQANEKLSATVRAAAPVAAAIPDVIAAENAKYSIGVYGFGVSAEAYELVRRS